MKYIWLIIFWGLPIVGIVYTAWRVWHLLPFAIATKTQYYISSGMGIWGGKFRIGTQSEYVVLTIEHISKLRTDSYKIIESFQPLIHLR